MRFGIKELQFDYLLPSRFESEGASSDLPVFDHADLVRRLSTQGFRLVELNGDLSILFDNAFDPASIRRLKTLKNESGLSFTVHLPLWSVEPSTPLAPVREGSVRAVVDIIRATLPLDPDVYVLHAFGALASEFYRRRLPPDIHAALLRRFQASAVESIRSILERAGIASRKLAVETIEFPLDLTLEVADALDLSTTFDTGHVLSGFCGAVDVFDALEPCLPRLAEVHLHDAPRSRSQDKIEYGRDHAVLGSGDLDVGRLLDRLVRAGFDGPIVFELPVAKAITSLQRIRELRPGMSF